MYRLLCVIVTAVVCIYGANHQCWTIEQICDKIVADGDVNQDGSLQYEELATALFPGAELGGACLLKEQFVANWSAIYHDHISTAKEFFNNLDTNGDKELCLIEAATLFIQYDQNPMNGVIELEELLAFMHDYHPDSPKNGAAGGVC